jgi:hypothetical protein
MSSDTIQTKTLSIAFFIEKLDRPLPPIIDANLTIVRNNTSRSIIYNLQESFKMNPNKLFLVVFYTVIVNFGRITINLLNIHYLFLNAIQLFSQ